MQLACRFMRLRSRLRWGIIVLLPAILAASPARSDDAKSGSQSGPLCQGQRVFSCGHSFHYFVPPILSDLAKAAGIQGHVAVGLSSIGGSRVIQHWNVPDEKNKAKEALRAGKVDVLTLSPIHLPDEGIEKFARLALEHNPNVRITVQEFWLPFDIYDTTFKLRPKKVDHNAPTAAELRRLHEPYFRGMDEHVRELNKKLGKEAIFVAPVGQAVIALREKIIAGQAPGLKTQEDLFTDPVGHARAPLQALVAYCHFASVYRRSPVGLPMPAVLTKANNPNWNDQLNRLLQELAWESVAQHPLSGVKPERASAAGVPQVRAGQTAPLGVAKVDITPETPVRMYGYGARKTESEGIAGRLKAAALAIGDDGGEGPAILLTVDCGAVPAALREEVFQRVRAKTAIKPERFMLCNSHNHSGPDLKGMPSITGAEHERLARYAEQLTGRLEDVVRKALASRRPGRLAWTQGTVGFAANRRVLKDGKWAGFGAVPGAPVDHSLPLMRATDADGKLLALVVNYACHNTTLRGNFKQIHGDWAAAAQECIEADHPGAVALVTVGCGADADPCPHGTVELCQRHGRAMADEVKRLLAAGPWKSLSPRLTARMAPLVIPYDKLPPKEELEALAKKHYPLRRLLESLERGEKPPAAVNYQVAVWAFGLDLAMIFLADEVVVDYALRMKHQFEGNRLWINAYSNDVSRYVASTRLLKEGGYEVNNSLGALVTYGKPDRMQPPLEDRIVDHVRSLLPPVFRAPAVDAPVPPRTRPSGGKLR